MGQLEMGNSRSKLLFLAFLLAAMGRSQTVPPPRLVAPRDFAIMAWGRSPSDSKQLRLMKEAGLNVSGFCRSEDLDNVGLAGLGCFVDDGRVRGYDWNNLPSEESIRSRVEELRHQVGDHSAVVGFYLCDEPSVSMMAGLGRVSTILREAMPYKWPYINLFPAYANRAQLGQVDYNTYVQTFLEIVRPAFLSYDNYSLVNGEMQDSYFTNLEIIRRQAIESKIPFWTCLLVTALFNYMEPSDATFNLQVYTTLAYGARGIQYFKYFTPQVGNYRLGPIDQFGNRTASWDMLRRINYQVHALAPTLVRLHSTGVYHHPDLPEQCRPLAESRLVRDVETNAPSNQLTITPHFLLGEFTDLDGSSYLMIVNKDLRHSLNFRLRLRQENRKLLRVSSYTGQEDRAATETDWLAPGAGTLFRVQ